jgi:hypothetical protein
LRGISPLPHSSVHPTFFKNQIGLIVPIFGDDLMRMTKSCKGMNGWNWVGDGGDDLSVCVWHTFNSNVKTS